MASTALQDEMQAGVRALIDAIHGQIDIAAARLYAAGVTVERLMLWSDTSSTDRGMMVDGVRACTVSTRLVQDLSFEVQLAWHEPWTHLADCDKADDAGKLAELRKLVEK